ncbi:MAG: DUF3455 domain-containing protein [Caldilineaceae bacterium]|nr:DUF3455 domain-containing protein [Caldilineaceae bacterium]
MNNCPVRENQIKSHFRLLAYVTALVVALMAARPQPTYAEPVTPPSVPANIQAPAGNKLFLVGRAVGTQNYICLPSDTGVKFVLFTPQATLFDHYQQVTTHYFSPNPAEGGVIRAAWQHSKDSSTVWGQVMDGHSSTDPAFVAPGAIPWLLITVVGTQAGRTGNDTLTATTFIQRLNTSGGVAPTTGCASLADVGNRAYVPYTTDYYFYKKNGAGAAPNYR